MFVFSPVFEYNECNRFANCLCIGMYGWRCSFFVVVFVLYHFYWVMNCMVKRKVHSMIIVVVIIMCICMYYGCAVVSGVVVCFSIGILF